LALVRAFPEPTCFTHLLRHHSYTLVRPGTSEATSTQSSPHFVTAAHSCASSPEVQKARVTLSLGVSDTLSMGESAATFTARLRSRNLLFLRSVSAMVGFTLGHLLQHCTLVRPGTSAATATQSLPHFVVALLAFFSLRVRSIKAHLLLHCMYIRSTYPRGSYDPIFAELCHRLNQLCVFFWCPSTLAYSRPLGGGAHLVRHCEFVRPGTSAATATQSLPHFFTASIIFASSDFFRLPGAALSPIMMGPRWAHLLLHCTFVRPGTPVATSIQLVPHFFTASIIFASSSDVHLPELPFLLSMVGYHLVLACI
jgi:hypothetical protein